MNDKYLAELRENLRRIVTRDGNTARIPEILEQELDELVSFMAAALAKQDRESREAERKLIEREVWEAKHKEWVEHVQRIVNTPIEVIRDNGKYVTKEMITDVQRGQPDLLRVVIATPEKKKRRDREQT